MKKKHVADAIETLSQVMESIEKTPLTEERVVLQMQFVLVQLTLTDMLTGLEMDGLDFDQAVAVAVEGKRVIAESA